MGKRKMHGAVTEVVVAPVVKKIDPRYADWQLAYIEDTSGRLDHMPANLHAVETRSGHDAELQTVEQSWFPHARE